MAANRIAELERQMVGLKERWPAHSVPPSMFQRLEELEEALKKARGTEEKTDAQADGCGGLRKVPS
jgi:Flp pilus assembly protein CpaB